MMAIGIGIEMGAGIDAMMTAMIGGPEIATAMIEGDAMTMTAVMIDIEAAGRGEKAPGRGTGVDDLM